MHTFIQRSYLVFSLIFSLQVFSAQTIKEIKSLSGLETTLANIKLSKEKKKPLVVFDLDNTVYEMQTPKGSEQWFNSLIQDFQKTNALSFEQALEKALKSYTHSQIDASVRLVEKKTNTIIKRLQTQGYQVLAVTSRGNEVSDVTLKQLKSLGVSFSASAPQGHTPLAFNTKASIGTSSFIIYREGVLFTSGGNKGKLLFELLEKVKTSPAHLVFIDDKEKHLKNVSAACKEKNIQLTALRYSACDHRVLEFEEKRKGKKTEFKQYLDRPYSN